MSEYKLLPSAFKEIKKQMLFKIVPIYLLIGVGVWYFVFFKNNDNGDTVNATWALPLTIAIYVAFSGVGFYLGLKRQKATLSSYRLTISEGKITRELLNTPTISIDTIFIRSIQKFETGNYEVQGMDPADEIGISKHLENFSSLEAQLNELHPVTLNVKLALWKKYPHLLGILVVVAMLLARFSENKVVAISAAAFLVGVLSWSFFEIRRSKNIDARTKRIANRALIFFLAIACLSLLNFVMLKLLGINQK